MKTIEELVGNCLARIPTRPKKIKKFLLNSFSEEELQELCNYFKEQAEDETQKLHQTSGLSQSSLSGMIEVQIERYWSGYQFLHWNPANDKIDYIAQLSVLARCLEEATAEDFKP